MEGMASIALLLDGSISGHFVQLPESVYYQMGQSRLFVSTSYLSVKQTNVVAFILVLVTREGY